MFLVPRFGTFGLLPDRRRFVTKRSPTRMDGSSGSLENDVLEVAFSLHRVRCGVSSQAWGDCRRRDAERAVAGAVSSGGLVIGRLQWGVLLSAMFAEQFTYGVVANALATQIVRVRRIGPRRFLRSRRHLINKRSPCVFARFAPGDPPAGIVCPDR